MLKSQSSGRSARWGRLAAIVALGVATGLFSSWYIYGATLTWVTFVLVGCFVLGAWLEYRRERRLTTT